MSFSLSVITAVHNRDVELDACLTELLDVLPDLAARFDVTVVDDASEDGSYETAQHWSQRYPQVQTMHHGRRLGNAPALRSGLMRTQGEVVLFVRADASFSASDVYKLWWHATSRDVVASQPPTAEHTSWRNWFFTPEPHRSPPPALLLCRRRLLRGWLSSTTNEEPLTHLILQGNLPYGVTVVPRANALPRTSRIARVDAAQPAPIAASSTLAWKGQQS